MAEKEGFDCAIIPIRNDYRCVAAIKLAASNSPPDCCI